MKLVHYLPSVRLADGGIVRFVLDLCDGLARAGHEVVLLCHDGADAPAAWRAGEASLPRLVTLPRPIPGARLLGPRALAPARRELDGATALHVHGVWYPWNVQLVRRAASAGVRTVLSPHGMLSRWSMTQHPRRKRLFLAAFRPFLRTLDRLHCTSEQERRDVAESLSDVRSVAAPPLLDLEPFARLPGPDLARRRFGVEGPFALFLSRLHPKKGADVLVDALGLLAGRGRLVTAILAGQGDAPDEALLRERIARHDLGAQARLVGNVVGPEKLSLLQAASAVVLPSFHENFGFVVPEALACGTPVLTTRGLDLWREFEAGGGVRLVDRSPPAVADGLEALLGLPEPERHALGERGRAWVHATFEPSALIRRYEELYAGT